MPSTTKLFGLVLTARAGRRPSRTRGYGLVITDVDVARARARETRRGDGRHAVPTPTARRTPGDIPRRSQPIFPLEIAWKPQALAVP
jgi:hypothetical protein